MEREDTLFRARPHFLWGNALGRWLAPRSDVLAGSSSRGKEMAADGRRLAHVCMGRKGGGAARRDQEAGKNRTEWHVGNN